MEAIRNYFNPMPEWESELRREKIKKIDDEVEYQAKMHREVNYARRMPLTCLMNPTLNEKEERRRQRDVAKLKLAVPVNPLEEPESALSIEDHHHAKRDEAGIRKRHHKKNHLFEPIRPKASRHKSKRFLAAKPNGLQPIRGKPVRNTKHSGVVEKGSPVVPRIRNAWKKWTPKHVAKWLELLGLERYQLAVIAAGICGEEIESRLVDHRRLTEELGMNHCHAISFLMAIQDLVDLDIDYSHWQWSLPRVLEWLEERGLGVLVKKFKENAIHGGVLFRLSEPEFDALLNLHEIKHRHLLLMNLTRCIHSIHHKSRYPSSHVVAGWGIEQTQNWIEENNFDAAWHRLKRAHITNGLMLLAVKDDSLLNDVGLSNATVTRLRKHVDELMKQDSSNRKNLAKQAMTFFLVAIKTQRKEPEPERAGKAYFYKDGLAHTRSLNREASGKVIQARSVS